MWKEIRETKGISKKEFGKMVGYTQTDISMYEKGYKSLPIKLQIEYLKLRNNETDKKIIKIMEEL